MTNEDAIIILEAYKQRLVNSVTIGLDKDIEAYDLAIKALEQTDGDLISRNNLLKELEKWEWQELYLPIHFAELVADLPSAEKTAEWETVWVEEEREERNYCPVCNHYEYTKSNYCPTCGARMGGEEEC